MPLCLPLISCLARSMTYTITVRKFIIKGPIIYYFGVVSNQHASSAAHGKLGVETTIVSLYLCLHILKRALYMHLMSSDEALSSQKPLPFSHMNYDSPIVICPTGNASLPVIPKRLRCRQLMGSLELFLDQQCLPYAAL